MFCCGFCGITAFGGQTLQEANFKLVDPLPDFPAAAPPYAFNNMDMRAFMVEGHDLTAAAPRWHQCSLCHKAGKEGKLCHRMRHNLVISQEYQRRLLALHPLDAQLLSLTDVTMAVTNRVRGHARGEIHTDNCLLNTFLVNRGPAGDHAAAAADVPDQVKDILGVLKHTSPLVSKVKTLAEKDVPGHGLPLIPQKAIADITAQAASRNPAFMGLDPNVDGMSDIFSMVAVIDADPVVAQPAGPQPGGSRPVFKVGKVTLRDTGQDVDLITDSAGLPVKALKHRRRQRGGIGDDSSEEDEQQDEAPAVPPAFDTVAPDLPLPSLELQLTLELAVFAALFPHAIGAFKEGRFSDYLRHRMSCGFSLFTLHKPYLMIMYLIRQCNLLQSSCGESVLEREMKSYRKAHPDCSEEDVVRNALKFSVPNKIPGTPGWHYQALQDLLAMVQANGMPQLFWTCTMDDVSGEMDI